MKNINRYQDLLLEEVRINSDIEISKIQIQENVNSYLQPKNLFRFFEKKVGEKFINGSSKDFDIQQHLIKLSINFVYEKITSSLLESDDDQSIDWKPIVKSIVDNYYIQHNDYIMDVVSTFIDKQVKKFK